MSKPVKLTFVRDRCRCLLEGENTCVTVLEVVKLLCYVFVWCLTRGTVRRMYAFDRTLRLGWSRCGTEAGCGLRKTMPITSLLARTLLSSTGETLSLRALTSLWLIVFFFHFWHFMMQIKRVIKLLYVLPYKLIHMKAEPLLLQQKFGHSWLAENVNCRLLSLLHVNYCSQHSVVHSCNWQLINCRWFDWTTALLPAKVLVSTKPAPSTLQTPNLIRRCRVTLSDVQHCTIVTMTRCVWTYKMVLALWWWDSMTTRQPTAHYHRWQQQELATALVLVGSDSQDARAIHGSCRSAMVHLLAFVMNGLRLVVVATPGWRNGPLLSTRSDDYDVRKRFVVAAHALFDHMYICMGFRLICI